MRTVVGNVEILIDDEDSHLLFEYKWWSTPRGYVYRQVEGKTIYLHQAINNTPKGLHTDHINRVKTDNRKSNLRTVTSADNIRNTPARSKAKVKHVYKNTSGYKLDINLSNGSRLQRNFKTLEQAINAERKYNGIYH